MGQIIPFPMHEKPATDVHTEHCCKTCGCKYGEGQPDYRSDEPFIACSVVSGRKTQTYKCGMASTCL